MTDQIAEDEVVVEPDARRFAMDIHAAQELSYADLVLRHAKVLSLVRVLRKSRRRWQGNAKFLRDAEAVTRQIADKNVQAYMAVRADLDTARRWAKWFAAERDYLRAEVAKDYAAIAEKQRRDNARIAQVSALAEGWENATELGTDRPSVVTRAFAAEVRKALEVR